MFDITRRSLRILVLCKRQYTGKDLIDDKYGRLREIPLGLAMRGHEVKGICFSYRKRKTGAFLDQLDHCNIGVFWHSINMGRFIFPGIISYMRRVKELAVEFRPDIVLAMSDAFHIIYGKHIAQLVGAEFVADLYDNFESFVGTKLLGVRRSYIRAVASADKVVCVSEPLKSFITSNYHCNGGVSTIENGYDADLFRPLDRKMCRKKLGLPENAKLIGTAGAISKSRDIDTLFRATEKLGARYPELALVVAGTADTKLEWPANVRLHNLGCLPHEKIPSFFNALNVAVIPNSDSEFGRYCFPQKASEILACRVPVVAASVGTMKVLFWDKSDHLYEPGNVEQLSDKIDRLLVTPEETGIKTHEWKDIVEHYDKVLLD